MAQTEELRDEQTSPATPVQTEGMTQQDYEMAIEAILFAAGHPVTYEQLAKTAGPSRHLQLKH